MLSFHGRPHQLLTSQTLGEYYIYILNGFVGNKVIRFAAGSHVSCFMACRKLPWSPVAFEIFLLKVSSKSDRRQSALLHFFLFGKDTFFFKEMWRLKNLSWLFLEVITSEVSAFENLYLQEIQMWNRKTKNKSPFFLLHISVLFWVSKVHRGKSPFQKVPLVSDDEIFLGPRRPPFLGNFFVP